MKYIKLGLLMAVFSFITIAQMGCASQEPISRTSFYLNTTCTVTIYDMEEDQAQELITKCFDKCMELENLLSRNMETSDIAKINAAGGKPVKVADVTLELLEKGIYYGELSDGAFDITVGRLTDLWDYTAEDPVLPAREDLEAALATIDYKNIQINGDTVTLLNPEASLDLGGIAKGYIADLLGEMLAEEGVEKAIINLGGNIVAIGEKEEGTPWDIGIEKPYSDRTEIVGVLGLSDETVVTAGIYERFFEKDGTLYHHILDTHTGYPAVSDLDAVTITGPLGSSVDCDALSTIALMLGSEKGKALIESIEGLEASFILKDGSVICTSGMDYTSA